VFWPQAVPWISSDYSAGRCSFVPKLQQESHRPGCTIFLAVLEFCSGSNVEFSRLATAFQKLENHTLARTIPPREKGFRTFNHVLHQFSTSAKMLS
jgi:hypothetical protein